MLSLCYFVRSSLIADMSVIVSYGASASASGWRFKIISQKNKNPEHANGYYLNVFQTTPLIKSLV